MDKLNDNDSVTIPREEYNELVEDGEFLALLEEEGVQKWTGYKSALIKQYEKECNSEDK